MPELPEVEVVRRGLDRWVSGRTVRSVTVYHPRSVRRHAAGPDDFAAQLAGRTLGAAQRRGKYLWLPIPGTGSSLIGHLGMSGQLLVQPEDAPAETHLRVRIRFADDAGTELRFVDQRTFGGLAVEDADPSDPESAPLSLGHIARDPLDSRFDDTAFLAALRRRGSGVKRNLLDQTLISGVGNIYADEALWRSKLHFERPADTLTRAQAALLLASARDVMSAALAVGGTSFDSLYVNVNGESGYFSRTLDAYGREGEPCNRCATPMRRAPWMNRSSYYCPRCQRLPRLPGPR
ncbi:bifunctional DNA-formamidopyrimidine glycosylase/DNA-(apurinic or apyrimidinic site) lyase [Streptacidiphilus sp. PB12-B1b]|uniref:bifunctional DNA-formamidopyrimidine glycosylase/DNA-(apurinic or apyrimidinic site) lyase n=1 Tax=Streptacidiphilus sp. PB12-B1b TaxID=2705012 RepID=UPI0015FB34F3|nr:bifunctional DNA-formamidopyrimidine glycosylase/DNA-(apurinic or apyrimidinic site) lyase [Streptacidiphilus sp. PB12-B1b]QMU78933.1 bifunctional DNA-formamidopyrimidine glycosylase/DNA-(apurinic or apyrimidinic site) lyase [Streptacidiphilus sp. PB12-B1b]